MARPSKLTEAQWAEIKRRMVAGESAASLGREYGVSRSAVTEHVSRQVETIRTVANAIVETETALRAMPLADQIVATRHAEDLRAISGHIAGAAKYSAATAHRLAGIAHGAVQKIDDANPLADVGTLQQVAALTKMSNEASVIPMGLLAANKERVKQLDEPPPEEQQPQRPQISREEWTKLHALP